MRQTLLNADTPTTPPDGPQPREAARTGNRMAAARTNLGTAHASLADALNASGYLAGRPENRPDETDVPEHPDPSCHYSGSGTLAAHLRRLIDAKTEVQYSAAVLTGSRASDLMKAAHRLIAGMDEVLRQA